MEILNTLLALVISNPAVSAVVGAAIVALVGIGIRVATLTPNTVDDSIFGFLGKMLGIKSEDVAGSKEALSAQPKQEDLPILRERAEGKGDGDKAQAK